MKLHPTAASTMLRAWCLPIAKLLWSATSDSPKTMIEFSVCIGNDGSKGCSYHRKYWGAKREYIWWFVWPKSIIKMATLDDSKVVATIDTCGYFAKAI